MNNNLKNIIAINNLIGYGKLDAKFNFFAIEENAGDDNTMTAEEKKDDMMLQEIIINQYSHNPYSVSTEQLINGMGTNRTEWLDRLNNNAPKNNLYTCIRSIYNYFNHDDKIQNSFIGYSKFNLLFGNFFPIGKKNTSIEDYPQIIKTLYCINNFSEYNNGLYRKQREIIFRNFLNNYIINSNDEKYLFTFGYKQIDYIDFLNRILKDHLNVLGKKKIPAYKFFLKARQQDRYFYIKINNAHIYSFYHTGNGWLNIKQINKLIDRNFSNIN